MDILLVAFGNPKQEKWLAMHRSRIHVPVCIGVGASIDFMSGKHPRAPGWMQRHGLEWLHRFMKEPRRLGGRYSRNAVGIVLYLSRQVLAVSTQRRSAHPFSLSVVEEHRALIVRVDGEFTGQGLEDFQNALSNSSYVDSALILDLTRTTYIGADGLGVLLDLSSKIREHRQELWLVGVQPSLRRLFRTAFLHRRLFRMAPKVSDALRRIDSMAHDTEPQALLQGLFKEDAAEQDSRLSSNTM